MFMHGVRVHMFTYARHAGAARKHFLKALGRMEKSARLSKTTRGKSLRGAGGNKINDTGQEPSWGPQL